MHGHLLKISNPNYRTINTAFVGLHLLLSFSIAEEDSYCVPFDHIKNRYCPCSSSKVSNVYNIIEGVLIIFDHISHNCIPVVIQFKPISTTIIDEKQEEF
jgi:hypothetical protein